MHKPQRILIVLGLLAALAGAAAANRQSLARQAFEITGETEAPKQALGLAQYVLFSATRPPLRLAPEAEIEHAAVNPFGINTFLHLEVEEAKREEQLRLISEAGFAWIRQEFPWEDIEIHARGDFIDRRNDQAGVDAWAKYDNIVALAARYDIQIIARIDNPPNWSRAAGDSMGAFAPPDDLQDFATFASTLAARYKGQIRYYQVWNEPNIYPEWGEQPVDPEGYTDLLCMAYRAIKEADPEAVVLSGALAPTAELSGRDFNDYLFLQRMYDAGAGACFDIMSMQGYALWSGPSDRRMRPLVLNYSRNLFIRDIMVRNGDAHKAIWISEMNWNASPPEVIEPRFGRWTLEEQARFAPLAYQRAEEEWPWMGVVNFWYFKRADDQWLREQRPEAYFQMAQPDFTLMPVYQTLKAYTGQPAVVYPGSHPPDHWAVTQEVRSYRFIFEGASLSIRYSGPARDALCGASLSIDNRNSVAAHGCSGVLEWHGRPGRHDVRVSSLNEIALERIVVRDSHPAIPGLIVALAMAVAAWISVDVRRQIARQRNR